MQTVNFTYFPLRQGDVVLDLGCGEGRHVIAAYVEAEVQSIGVDLALADLQTTRDKYQDFAAPDDPHRSFALAAATALALPFADNSFDKVICSEVLEHIPDYSAALAEIQRVLKPGGLLCVSVPRRWPEKLCWALSRAYHQVAGGHLRIFRAKELSGEIESLGFKRYQRHWAHALHAPYWWLRCLFWNNQDNNFLVRHYHRLLVWDLMERPALTRILERCLNPLLGKSVVMYFRKGEAT
ncbi:class I SAM-dependent methyltransferase [Parahaliea sp. F7430]|uniref:Class I SAM-dependent methyltransferase n=1 Tax=Sediminihaliea albiluteola TaxID=2758564 RepID=A0A7W2TXR3_9GAMM|nr:class I SAM-dependent methyltransferase [Sediminihaliea albiluteola]MBA6413852.1 class I SAM-dependent methyltransferase [Sediminihaliea albiluteola]